MTNVISVFCGNFRLINFLNMKKSTAEAPRLLIEAYCTDALGCCVRFCIFKKEKFHFKDKERSENPKVHKHV